MDTSLEILCRGKILYVCDEYIIFARGYNLYKQGIRTKKNEYYCSVHDNGKYPFLSRFKLTRRLFRAEITSFYRNGDTEYCIAKKGIFRRKKEEKHFTKVFSIKRGSRPLNLCFTDEWIFWGEYFANMDKNAVNIYGSNDNGNSWNVVFTFAKGEINHIHGIFKDPYENKIWVATGDRENECIIGYTENYFKTFNIVFRDNQQYRTCNLFFYRDFIIFVTDSQYEKNRIRRFSKNSSETTDISEVQSSVIKGGQCGDKSFFSTAIEPSDVNTDKFAHIWLSSDGENWRDAIAAKKDVYHMILQFGTFEFPTYHTGKPVDYLYFSGKALKGIDNKVCRIKI